MDTKFCYTEIEITFQVFLHCSQILNVFTFADTADIYLIIHFDPHSRQRFTVDQSHSSGILRRSLRLAGNEGTKTVSFTNSQKKKSHGAKSGDRGVHRINALSSCPVRPTHLCGKN
jgi:hypothetical protein